MQRPACWFGLLPASYYKPGKLVFKFADGGTYAEVTVRRELVGCNRRRLLERVQFGTLFDVTETGKRKGTCLQNGCACNLFGAEIMRRFTVKGKPMPNVTHLRDQPWGKLYYEFDRTYVNAWKKSTWSRAFSMDELVAWKEGRTDAIQQRCEEFGIPSKAGNVGRYRQVRDFFRMDGYDTTKTVKPSHARMRRWAVIKSFPKVECLPGGKWPRPISAPSPQWNVVMSQWNAPAEKGMYYLFNTENWKGLTRWLPYAHGPLIAKAFNSMEKAHWVQEKKRHLEGITGETVHVASIDCTSHDAHCRVPHLERLGDNLEKMFPLDAAYIHQEWTHVENPTGANEYYTWKASGGVSSGHPWTANGTCYMVVSNLVVGAKRIACDRAGVEYGSKLDPREELKFDLLSDGDDVLLFFAESDLWAFEKLQEHFEDIGHEMTVERVSSQLEDVVWCQSKLVRVVDTDGVPVWKFVQDPTKVFHILASMVHMNDPSNAEGYLGQVFQAYSILNKGIPVYRHMPSLCPPPKTTKQHQTADSGFLVYLSRESTAKFDVDENTYVSFAKAWFPDNPSMVEVIEDELKSSGGSRWIYESFLPGGSATSIEGGESWPVS